MSSIARRLPAIAAGVIARRALNDLYSYGKTSMYGRSRPGRSYSVRPRRYRSRYRYGRRSRRARGKRRRIRRTRYVGTPVGLGTCKRTLMNSNSDVGLLVPTRVLQSGDLTWIPKTTVNDINSRQRDIINLRGIRLEYSVGVQAAATQPVILHMALVSFRGADDIPNNNQGWVSPFPVQVSNFFRGNGNSRTVNFSATLTSIQLHRLNINADNYNVISRWSHRFNTLADDSESSQVRNFRKYFPVRRQIRYDSPEVPAERATSGRILLVWWCDFMNGLGTAAGSTADVLRMDHHHVTYWREPVGC